MAARLVLIDNEAEWHNYRGRGLGASDIATLLGYNPNKSKLELFYDKIGFRSKPFINLRMLYGKTTEELTSLMYECFTGNNQTHAGLIHQKRRSRFCYKFPQHSFVVNDDIKYLYVSPDRGMIRKPGEGWDDIYGYIEIKDTSSMYLKNYENEIAPMHIIQNKTQLWAGEKEEGLLAYIIDGGRAYKEHPIKRDGIIFNDEKRGKIITEEYLKQEIEDFWDAVVLAREATYNKMQAELNFNMQAAAEFQSIIDQCEPEPDDTLAYEAYMKDTAYAIQRPKIEITGNEEHLEIANSFIETKEVLKAAESAFQLQKNKVLNVCKQGHKIILPGKGFIEVAKTKVSQSIKVKV